MRPAPCFIRKDAAGDNTNPYTGLRRWSWAKVLALRSLDARERLLVDCTVLGTLIYLCYLPVFNPGIEGSISTFTNDKLDQLVALDSRYYTPRKQTSPAWCSH